MRRSLLATGLILAMAVPAVMAGPTEDRWRGNVRCDDGLRSRFEVSLTDGRFSHTGLNLTISGEIRSGKYDVRGRYRDDDFSVSGTFAGDAINASDGGLFTTCYVNLFRISSTREQHALGAVSRDAQATSDKRKTSAIVGVVTTTDTVGVQSSIPTPRELAAKAAAANAKAETEIGRLKKELEEARQAGEARDAEAAAEEKARATLMARLGRDIEGAGDESGALRSRVAQLARLRQETEDRKKAEADRKARHAEAEKARQTELARLKREAEKARKAGEAEIARLKRQAENAKKARESEIARLRQEVEDARTTRSLGAGEPMAPVIEADFGTYHALVIGINGYRNLPKLKTAVNDAKTVARVLKDDYGFRVTLLIDPSRGDILDALDEYQETLGELDNLLIYYAGHGWLNEEVDRGYWLPVDAEPNRRRGWVSNATITDTLKGLAAKHVMVVSDSCYSGTLVRAAKVGTRTRTGDYWKRMAAKWTRVALTSGGLEPVVDKGGGGNSPFAKAFVDALAANDGIMDGTQLFSRMRRPVMVAAKQTPQYSDVREAGHDGGDFLFVRRQ